MAGTGIKLTFKVDFEEAALKQEILTALKEIDPAAAKANAAVGEAAKDALKRHIQSDIYDKWTPTHYQRRYEGGLLNEGAITIKAENRRMMLTYEPGGESPQWDNPASGNALIGRIESGSGYEWDKHPGARPFWKAFTNEAVNSIFASVFDAEMAAQLSGSGFEYIGGTVVESQSDDGDY